jgi:hypothetical protein
MIPVKMIFLDNEKKRKSDDAFVAYGMMHQKR